MLFHDKNFFTKTGSLLGMTAAFKGILWNADENTEVSS